MAYHLQTARSYAAVAAGLVALLLLLGGCPSKTTGSDPDGSVRPDRYIGSCENEPVPAFGGGYQSVISRLTILDARQGFDLDYDGEVDNRLAPLGVLANAEIDTAFDEADIIIPFEFFGLDSGTDDDCLNFSVYIGEWPPDQDADGERSGGSVPDAERDCNDFDAAINPDATEIVGDGVDNDCNGWADETLDASMNVVPSSDTLDVDGDGYSLAAGDCDDRDPAEWTGAPSWWDPARINPGAAEVCGDGLDNNCDGVADENCDVYTTADGADDTVPLDPLSLTTDQSESIVVFRSSRIVGGRLFGGPSVFSFSVEVNRNPVILEITSAYVEADVTLDQFGVTLSNGILGGVLSGPSLDRSPNVLDGFFGEPDNTLLDVFIGPGGTLMGLPSVGVCRSTIDDTPTLPIARCDTRDDCPGTDQRCDTDVRAPDIDIDGDGIELFLDSNLDGDDQVFRADTCVDGDGTVFYDVVDGNGVVLQHCSEEVDGDGNPRFVDGYSIAVAFTATPTNLYGIITR